MKPEFIRTRLSLRSRFIIAVIIYATAALLQFLLIRGENIPLSLFRFAGFAILIIPIWFLKVRNFSNKPPFKSGSKKDSAADPELDGAWRPVSLTDLDRIRDRIAATERVKIPFAHNLVFGILLSFFSPFLFIPAIIFAGITGFFVLIDLYLVFFPFIWFARIEKWYPEINEKLAAFAPVLEAKLPRNLRLTPMLFFDGKNQAAGTQTPADMRIMLAPVTSAETSAGTRQGRGTPPANGTRGEVLEELVGVQFQVTYNKGPRGEVPYMYAVFITKGMGKVYKSLKNVSAQGYVTEAGSSGEGDTVYGTIVLRLDTKSRSDGYHTHENDVKELLALVLQALEKL